jgi:hypothetical protein
VALRHFAVVHTATPSGNLGDAQVTLSSVLAEANPNGNVTYNFQEQAEPDPPRQRAAPLSVVNGRYYYSPDLQ